MVWPNLREVHELRRVHEGSPEKEEGPYEKDDCVQAVLLCRALVCCCQCSEEYQTDKAAGRANEEERPSAEAIHIES